VPIKTLGAQLFQLISAQLFLHATMAGTRMAAPLLMLREGYSPAAVGLLLAFFGLTQVVLAIPAGRYADRRPAWAQRWLWCGPFTPCCA
jgi:MFS family permease